MNHEKSTRDFSLIRVIKGVKKGGILPCTRDQRLYIGSDPKKCDMVLEQKGVSPVHASVFFDPVNRLFGVKDLSDQGMVLEDGLDFPTERTIHIPEGTILYLGSEDQAIMLGSKDATSYMTNILPQGTLIREKYIIESQPLQILNGMMYNGIRLTGGDTPSEDNPAVLQEDFSSPLNEPVRIYCTLRDPYKSQNQIPELEGNIPILEVVNEYDVIFYILPFDIDEIILDLDLSADRPGAAPQLH